MIFQDIPIFIGGLSEDFLKKISGLSQEFLRTFSRLQEHGLTRYFYITKTILDNKLIPSMVNY